MSVVFRVCTESQPWTRLQTAREDKVEDKPESTAQRGETDRRRLDDRALFLRLVQLHSLCVSPFSIIGYGAVCQSCLVDHSSRPTRFTDTQTHEHMRAKEAAKLKETTRQKNKRKEKLGQAKFTVKDAREYRRESPWALLLHALSFVLFDVRLVTDCGVKAYSEQVPRYLARRPVMTHAADALDSYSLLSWSDCLFPTLSSNEREHSWRNGKMPECGSRLGATVQPPLLLPKCCATVTSKVAQFYRPRRRVRGDTATECRRFRRQLDGLRDQGHRSIGPRRRRHLRLDPCEPRPVC